MLTEGTTNSQYGEFQENAFNLIGPVEIKMNAQYFYFTDSQQRNRVRLYVYEGMLRYDIYDLTQDIWISGNILTPDSEYSERIPAGATTNYITLTDSLFRITQGGVTTLQMDPGLIELQSKQITGLLAGTTPDSAVTLEQLQSVVAGESTDVIISTDLHTSVRALSSEVPVLINQIPALTLYKPNIEELVTDYHLADELVFNTGANTIQLTFNTVFESLDVYIENNRIKTSEPIAYNFNTSSITLQPEDIPDLKAIEARFISKTANSDLIMNGYEVKGAADASQSEDLCTLGELTFHEYFYAFTTNDYSPIAATFPLDFNELIQPQALTPAVPQRITQSMPGVFTFESGTYRVTTHIVARYNTSTEYPIQTVLIADNFEVPQSKLQCSNVDSYSRDVHSERAFVVRITYPEEVYLRVNCTPAFVTIRPGCSLDIETLQ